MSLYLFQDEKQTGPFNDEQILRLLQSGQVTTETLAWKEGMDSWVPLQTVMPRPGQSVVMPPPRSQRSVLGTISFALAVLAIPAWIVLLVVAGVAHSHGTPPRSFDVGVGLFFFLGIGVNLVGLVLGIIGIFQSRARTFSILGVCLNALCIVALIGVLALGLAVGRTHAG